jgi:hypothetical protein
VTEGVGENCQNMCKCGRMSVGEGMAYARRSLATSSVKPVPSVFAIWSDSMTARLLPLLLPNAIHNPQSVHPPPAPTPLHLVFPHAAIL